MAVVFTAVMAAVATSMAIPSLRARPTPNRAQISSARISSRRVWGLIGIPRASKEKNILNSRPVDSDEGQEFFGVLDNILTGSDPKTPNKNHSTHITDDDEFVWDESRDVLFRTRFEACLGLLRLSVEELTRETKKLAQVNQDLLTQIKQQNIAKLNGGKASQAERLSELRAQYEEYSVKSKEMQEAQRAIQEEMEKITEGEHVVKAEEENSIENVVKRPKKRFGLDGRELTEIYPMTGDDIDSQEWEFELLLDGLRSAMAGGSIEAHIREHIEEITIDFIKWLSKQERSIKDETLKKKFSHLVGRVAFYREKYANIKAQIPPPSPPPKPKPLNTLSTSPNLEEYSQNVLDSDREKSKKVLPHRQLDKSYEDTSIQTNAIPQSASTKTREWLTHWLKPQYPQKTQEKPKGLDVIDSVMKEEKSVDEIKDPEFSPDIAGLEAKSPSEAREIFHKIAASRVENGELESTPPKSDLGKIYGIKAESDDVLENPLNAPWTDLDKVVDSVYPPKSDQDAGILLQPEQAFRHVKDPILDNNPRLKDQVLQERKEFSRLDYQKTLQEGVGDRFKADTTYSLKPKIKAAVKGFSHEIEMFAEDLISRLLASDGFEERLRVLRQFVDKPTGDQIQEQEGVIRIQTSHDPDRIDPNALLHKLSIQISDVTRKRDLEAEQEAIPIGSESIEDILNASAQQDTNYQVIHIFAY
ncbi:hypothetical protein AAMO2058_001587700 [Amorphochlora amoebiformis]